ncbi:MAG: fatty acyl-AMP ligase, partial [Chloroflexota bacterium]
MTYGQLDVQARTIAAYLQATGMTGERALLVYQPGLDYLAAFMGCLYAGAIAVPTYPPALNRPDLRFETILNDAQPKAILTHSDTLTKLEKRANKLSTFTDIHSVASDTLDGHLADMWQNPSLGTDDLAFLQYTSGSTSLPKGVMVSHGNLISQATISAVRYEDTEKSQGVVWLPPYHDMGLIGGILQPLYDNYPVVLMPPAAFLQKPIRWLRAITKYKGTTSVGPNFAYDLCVDRTTPEQRANLDLSSWTLAFNGAEPISMETLTRFTETFAPYGFQKRSFYPCYGLAEATLMVSGDSRNAQPTFVELEVSALEQSKLKDGSPTDAASQEIVSCGPVVDNHQLHIVNPDTSRICEPNQIGEIWIAGPNIALGYWNKPQETKESFQATLADGDGTHFLRTGDLGFVKDRNLFVTGRLKDLIIIRGRNHYPQDIEQVAEQCHPAISPMSC